ncbi:FAS1 domain-containing protein [Backusella circina FSU 941]|nr:FAS1 domain-containing protein [Backusella circina FSU 941]
MVLCGENSIFDIIVKEKQLSKLTQQLEILNLTQYVKQLKGATVFAPVDSAFEQQDEDITIDQLLYHIIRPAYTTDDLRDGMLLKTDTRHWVKVSSKAGLFIGNAKIRQENIEASNGYIHMIDRVLSLPESLNNTIAAHPDLKDFSEKMSQSGVDKYLEKKKIDHTVFAISGDLFDSIDPLQKSYLETPQAKEDVARLLYYLVVPEAHYTKDLKKGKTILKTVGGLEDLVIVKNHDGITVNGIKLVEQDILSSNGVIHILEQPLLPKDMDTFLKMNSRKALAGMHYGSRLVDLFDQYGLGIYLDNENDVITLLAPPDDEMGDDLVPSGKIESWLKYHIIQGYFPPEDLRQHQLLLTKSHDEMGPKEYQRIKVHVNDPALDKPSIQFGKISVLGDPVYVNKKLIIYRISHSLYLPRGPLRQLPTNHALSTFVASLYGTGAGETIKHAHGITLFAPTNAAFDRLGLVSKFLFQPEATDKLAQVVTFHAVRHLFYDDATISPGEHREPTLAGPEVQINKTSDGELYFGDAHVSGRTMLTSNGVIHTIDRVQLDPDLVVTNRNLTTAQDLHSFVSLLAKTELAHVLDDAHTLLAPNDRAFSRLDLEALLHDRAKLEALVRLHVLPAAFPDLSDNEDISSTKIGFTGAQFDTLLPDHPVTISKNLRGGYSVGVAGQANDGYVTDFGRSSSGGGVIVIDRVLVPSEETTGLPWWAILLITLASLAGAALLCVTGYYGYQWYQHREGQILLSSTA